MCVCWGGPNPDTGKPNVFFLIYRVQKPVVPKNESYIQYLPKFNCSSAMSVSPSLYAAVQLHCEPLKFNYMANSSLQPYSPAKEDIIIILPPLFSNAGNA